MLLFAGSHLLWGQDSSADTLRGGSNQLGLGADSFIYASTEDGEQHDTLVGNVKITQDSFFLYCDTAYVKNKAEVQAYGNVIITQGDSIEIFCDALNYNDVKQKAELFGRIVFKKGEKRLNTEHAQYDIVNKKAFYTEGATLINLSQKLISESGEYDIVGDRALFQGKVSVQDSSSLLQTDSLRYDLQTEVVSLISPSNILKDSTEIYCERGFYDYKNQIGEFYKNLEIKSGSKTIVADKVKFVNADKTYTLTGNPVVRDLDSYAKAHQIVYFEQTEIVDLIGDAYYKSAEQELTSDQIRYNTLTDEYETSGGSEVIDDSGRILKAELLYREKDGTDVAQKNVILTDPKEKIVLYGEILKSNPSSGSYHTYNTTPNSQPLLVKELNDEEFFLKSDTLSYTKKDSVEYYTGSGNISFLNGDIAGQSEKLKYDLSDSSYQFTENPKLWSDSLQITGDTIIVTVSDGNISKMEVITNAFMIIQNPHSTFDQVKGDFITLFFKDNKIEDIVVTDNVEMVYFMYDEKELTGVNHSFCGELIFTFVNDDLEHLRFKDKPNSKFSKGGIANPESFNLQGFEWEADQKPNKISFKK